ncbi:MAG: alpha/beta hydrolase [Oscillospiraceae bacterium]|nr:alpha/beta hydrolase [Oscillospiraceae bacterium]
MSFRKEIVRIGTPAGRLRLLILNRRPGEKRPCVLWIHGGGYSMGLPEMVYFSRGLDLVKKFGFVLVSPDYRRSGRAPFPAAPEDCYAALRWLWEHADELGADRSRLFVGGESAGGGLCAAVCMMARDRGEISVAFQLPLYPMLDDRETESSRDNHAPVWNTRRNRRAWAKYLRSLPREDLSPYAAPARQTDLRGLPPCYTFVGTREPFYCETLRFTERLRAAGVAAEADVYPGMFHAFDIFLPFSREGREARASFARHVAAALEESSAKEE